MDGLRLDARSAPRGAAGPRTAPPGPLVARPAVPEPARRRVAARPPRGRFRRFVLRYGWRAYAVPLLTIATVAVLLELAFAPGNPLAGSAAAGTLAPDTVTVPTGQRAPTGPAEGDVDVSRAPQVAGEETYVERGDGSLSVVDGSSDVFGSGPLQRFIVKV